MLREGTYQDIEALLRWIGQQDDLDADGIGDACDTCSSDPDNDIDGDTICGDVDNCPGTPNTGQLNSDTDSLGDDCDNCPNDDNAAQDDADSDGLCFSAGCRDALGSSCSVYLGLKAGQCISDGVCAACGCTCFRSGWAGSGAAWRWPRIPTASRRCCARCSPV